MRRDGRPRAGYPPGKIVARWQAARGDLWATAEALLAFRRGDDSDDAMVGALIEADNRNDIRLIASVFEKK